MCDLLIQNALIYDGSGAPAYHGCVAVKDGKILYAGPEYAGAAEKTVDAKGLALSPGFIDTHSHADYNLFADPHRLHVLRMGVTTELAGQCGVTMSPIPADTPDHIKAALKKPTSPQFSSLAEQREAIKSLELGPNMKFFAGHSPIRSVTMGIGDDEATEEDIAKMQALIRQQMDEGSLGYSTGLSYTPGIYSNTYELTELAKAAAEKGGMYTTHSRSESAGLFKSVEECIHIAREAKIPVNISHFKVVGKVWWERCAKALSMIDDAIAEGLNVTLDAYPYIAVCTTPLSTVPPQFLTEGGEAFAKKLHDPKVAEAVYHYIFEVDDPSWDNSMFYVGLENFLIARAHATPWAVGKTYVQVAQELGMQPFEAWVHLMKLNNGQMYESRFAMCEENVEMILKHPKCMVGSDGVYSPGDLTAHPRAFGSFPRYLGHYIRDRKILSREEGIHRITGMPAQVYKLKGKGLIREDYDADLVLFDYDNIQDHADFMDCFKRNEGIHQVYIGGQLVLQDNEPTDTWIGKYI